MFLFLKGHKLEMTRHLWLLVYVAGLVVTSFLGDPNYVLDNFLPFGPQGIIAMPYDAILVMIFSLAMFVWGYYSNTGRKSVEAEQIQKEAPKTQ